MSERAASAIAPGLRRCQPQYLLGEALLASGAASRLCVNIWLRRCNAAVGGLSRSSRVSSVGGVSARPQRGSEDPCPESSLGVAPDLGCALGVILLGRGGSSVPDLASDGGAAFLDLEDPLEALPDHLQRGRSHFYTSGGPGKVELARPRWINLAATSGKLC